MGYGIDPNKLDEFIGKPEALLRPWGKETPLFAREEFNLRKIDLEQGKDFLLDTGTGEATIYIEEGSADVSGVLLSKGGVMSLAPGEHRLITASQLTIFYIFAGPQSGAYQATYDQAQTTSDVREKYWGTIETIVSRAYAGKRIFCQTDKHSSLEYHCQKTEGYYVHSGILLVRIRAGRAEDKVFELSAGQSMFIPQGLMHQRGGRHDAVVIEISTADDDADSFLVEDGQKSPMPGLI